MSDWWLEDDDISAGKRLDEKKMPSLAHGIEESLRTTRGEKIIITLTTRDGRKYTGKSLRMEQQGSGEVMMITLITGDACCTDCWPGGGHTMPIDVLAEAVFRWKEGENVENKTHA